MESVALVWKLIFLNFCSAFLPSFAKWFVSSKHKKTSEEKKLISDLREMKRELASMSMVDEFAKYAKLQRKVTKTQEDLKSLANSRMLTTTKNSLIATQAVNAVMGVCLIYMVWMHKYEPVLLMPEGWLYPLENLLSWPTGEAGAISVTSWLLLSRTTIGVLSNKL